MRYVNLDPNTETETDLSALLSGAALSGEQSSLEGTHKSGERISGKVVGSGFAVTDQGVDAHGVGYMVAQACLDLSGSRTVDSSGNDVTPDRDNRLSVQMKAEKVGDGSWRISESVRNEDVHACG